MTSYRAIISIPIETDNDDKAFALAVRHAHKLTHMGIVIGHVESVGEVQPDGLLQVSRSVYEDPNFRKQIA